jgi:hypothetical protein
MANSFAWTDIPAKETRMKTRLVIGLMCALAAASGAAAQLWEDHEEIRSPEEARRRTEAAINGSAQDSYLLARYYSWEETYNFPNRYFFLRLSAEQGSCEGLIELARLQRTIIKDLVDGTDWNARARAACRQP